MKRGSAPILAPVTSRSGPTLTDGAARPPKGTPKGDDLDGETDVLLERLGELQEVFYADARRSLLVVLQGRDAAGKDGTIRRVFEPCNPQGCQVTSFGVPSTLEMRHDYLWRIHQAVPARGMIGIFNRSHYEDVLVVRVRDLVPRSVWSKRYDHINAFERMLAESGVTILKFFLHVSRDEQKERLRERLDDPEKNWKFRAGDLDDRALWDDYSRAYREAITRCSTPWAPWYVVPADKKRARDYLVAQVIVAALEGLKPRYPKADEDVLAAADKIV
ncbi:MAG: PPK2 family polyphosphate kinase [Gemmatimonadaceae bacterium]